MGDYIYENPPRRGLPRRHAGGEPADLAGYRARHAQYKTDRDLQAAHASHPFVVAWDDHEVENDYAGRHPVEGGDPAAPSCDEGGRGGGRVVTCPERVDPRRTILGDHQRRWLLRGLDRSQARWNVLAQQVVMAPLDLHPGPGRSWWSDAWDGYVADRERILRFLWERQPANPVVLTGDIHAFLVNDLQLPGQGAGAPVVATELVGTSISSGASKSSGFRRHLRDNPHVRFFESRLRGYTRCTVIRERWYADLRVVDTVERPGRRSAPSPAGLWKTAGQAPNRSRMERVDNNIWGCLGSTVTDRSRGSEPEFAGLRTKPRKTQAPSLTTRSQPKVS